MKIKILAVFLALCSVFCLSSCHLLSDNEDSGNWEVSLDLNAEWDKVNESGSLVQGCIVVRKAFLTQYPDAVHNFLNDYQASVNALLTSPDTVAPYIVEAGLFANETIAKQAIPNCNICYLTEQPMKDAMSSYLSALNQIAPQSIGGSIPDDNFYYFEADYAPHVSNSNQLRSFVNVFSLNGTTGFGLAQMMHEAKAGNLTKENYVFTVRSDASDVSAALISGDADIAALPTNAAANLYAKTEGDIVLLAVNTKGCLYLLSNSGEIIGSIADLKGKTVYVPAQNPTFIMKYLCEANQLEVGKDVILDSSTYATALSLREAVIAGSVQYAVLPEPMVTVALAAVKTQEGN